MSERLTDAASCIECGSDTDGSDVLCGSCFDLAEEAFEAAQTAARDNDWMRDSSEGDRS